MKVKETGIYQIYRQCFPPHHMGQWKSQMENSYKKYLKGGNSTQECLNKLEVQYINILMDISVKHPELFKSKEVHRKVVDWMHSPESVIRVPQNNNVTQGE